MAQTHTGGEEQRQFPHEEKVETPETDLKTEDVGEQNRGTTDSREGLESEVPTQADSETRHLEDGNSTGVESKEGVEQPGVKAEEPALDADSPQGYVEKPQESGVGNFAQTEGKQTQEDEGGIPQGGETSRDWKPTEATQASRPRVDYGGLPEPTRPAGAVLLEDQRYSAPTRNETKNTTAPDEQPLESSAPGESSSANEATAVYPDDTKEGSSKSGLAAETHTEEETTHKPTEGVQEEKSPEFPAESTEEEKLSEVPPQDVQQEKPGLMSRIKSKLPGHKHTADAATPDQAPAAEVVTPAPQETTDNLDTPTEETPSEVDNAQSPSKVSKLKDKLVPNRLRKKDGADNVESPVAT